MFKKPQNSKGLTVNLGLFKQCSHVQIFFAFPWDESLWIVLTLYGINFKITNLDLF